MTAQKQAIQEGKSTWVETSAGFNWLLDEIAACRYACFSGEDGEE